MVRESGYEHFSIKTILPPNCYPNAPDLVSVMAASVKRRLHKIA